MTTQIETFPLAPISEAVTAMVERVAAGVVQVGSERRGQGAGVIWSANGLIMTNHHVVAHSRGQLRVTLGGERELLATLLASDQRLDLALLQVATTNLPAVPLGDSTHLRVGDLVFAIGHPWGQRGVVTAGIVSGLDTTPDSERGSGVPYIRTDTRLRPGNSGGPLLNARGEVVGINAMVFGGDLSIAIPSHVAGTWASSVAPSGGPRATLGVQVQTVELPASARQGTWATRSRGLLVVGLIEGGAAQRGGLLVGDALLEANGAATEQPGELAQLLAQPTPAAVVRLTVLRAGSVQTLEVGLI